MPTVQRPDQNTAMLAVLFCGMCYVSVVLFCGLLVVLLVESCYGMFAMLLVLWEKPF